MVAMLNHPIRHRVVDLARELASTPPTDRPDLSEGDRCLLRSFGYTALASGHGRRSWWLLRHIDPAAPRDRARWRHELRQIAAGTSTEVRLYFPDAIAWPCPPSAHQSLPTGTVVVH